MSIFRGNQPITSLQTWLELAGPKRTDQWVAGRSAMEAARIWLEAGNALPNAISAPLQQHPRFGRISVWRGEPEVRLAFDKRRGEPRNTDLLVTCGDEHGAYLLAVEAKADESFGETVAEALSASLERKLQNSRSGGIGRIQDLAAAVLGPREPNLPEVGELRYQLLTGTAGALAEGVRRDVDRVVFVVQEFRTTKTADDKHKRNSEDLAAFVRRLSKGSVGTVDSAVLYGPFRVPGAPLFAHVPDLFVLKVSHDLRSGV